MVSNYRVYRKIGSGGMGEVFLAEDTRLGRRVAIKFLTDECAKSDSDLRRFDQEAKAASSLNHPNILVIHEIGETARGHYIVSEFVEGETLREIGNKKRFTISEILDIAIQTAGALSAAHTASIVHRDIKPENIMVRPDGYVKVLDFGLAKLMSKPAAGLEDETRRRDTAKGVILGTVSYMSPEQARASSLDERTDIFSLGVVMYEMITGRTPFAGNSLAESLANLIEREPLPLANFSESVSPDLQRVVGKMLRKDRDERYQTMKGLLADLKELRGDGSREEKLVRATLPDDEKVTSIFEGPTASIKNVTNESHQGTASGGKFSAKRIGLFAGLAALVLGGLVYGWYWRQASNSAIAIKSLAVLPLRSLDAGENYLGLGIADAVIRRINQTGELTVRPTSAVRRYLTEDTDALTAARQLRADAVLEGSVQRADDRLRVSVNLLRTSDGISLWSDNFDMRSTDIFTIQDTVAQQVASRLRLQLDPSQQARLKSRYTSNPIAYDFYVKGIYNLDLRGLGDAKPQMETTIDFFKKAIESDPTYALAHAQLAYSYGWTALFIDPTDPKWATLAKEEIKRSQDLDPQLAESHIANSLLLWSAYENFQNEAAIRELLLAQKLNPSIGHADLAAIYGHIGLEDMASRELQRAVDADPTSQKNSDLTLTIYWLGGRTEEWFAAFQKFEPGKNAPLWYNLRTGHLADAQKAIDRFPENSDDQVLLSGDGLLHALKGDFSIAEAQVPKIVAKLNTNAQYRHHSTYDIACIYALAGNSEEAVKWLKETAATGFPNYPLFERDAYLNRIRQTPQFIQFMSEMKAQNERYRREFQ